MHIDFHEVRLFQFSFLNKRCCNKIVEDSSLDTCAALGNITTKAVAWQRVYIYLIFIFDVPITLTPL